VPSTRRAIKLIDAGYASRPAARRRLRIFYGSITSWQLLARRGVAACAAVATLSDSTDVLHAGELEIRLGEGLVLATGRALTLSVREFELLSAMAKRSGAIVARDELYTAVWGGSLRPGDRSVDVYVSKLRGKLEAAMPDRRFIHTHPGFGYRFQPQPAAGSLAAGPPQDEIERDGSGLSRDVHIRAPGD
jgi:DNA-binding response OmpR family regulator